jgi:hypothetical protein
MTTNMKRLTSILCCLILAACGKEDSADVRSTAKSSTLSDAYLLAQPPAGAKGVLELRANGHSGDDVVVTGRAKDFVDGRAVFTLTDTSYKPCNEEGPMGACKTPWDYCCTDASEIAKATMSIEFADPSAGGNNVAKTTAQGFHGLDHLKHVVVAGKLMKDDGGNLSVVAKGIYIE